MAFSKQRAISGVLRSSPQQSRLYHASALQATYAQTWFVPSRDGRFSLTSQCDTLVPMYTRHGRIRQDADSSKTQALPRRRLLLPSAFDPGARPAPGRPQDCEQPVRRDAFTSLRPASDSPPDARPLPPYQGATRLCRQELPIAGSPEVLIPGPPPWNSAGIVLPLGSAPTASAGRARLILCRQDARVGGQQRSRRGRLRRR